MADCGCTHHPGLSHAQHMDKLYREKNQKHLDVLNDPNADPQRRVLAGFAFMQEEAARLRDKEWAMRTGQWG